MAYRDDRRALESRRDDLRRELDEIRSKAEALRVATLVQEAVERELADAEARLAQHDVRRASLLDDVRVASPCKASWEAMVGDDHVRFCGECEKNVYDLSSLSRDEATRLLAEREGSICVRLYRRADGNVLTADCPVGARKKRVRLALYGAAGAGALSATALWSVTTAVMGKMPAPPEHEVVMGDIAARQDSYVRQPLTVGPAGGFVYRLEPQPGRPGARWRIRNDGHVTRVVDGASLPAEVRLDAEATVAAQEILALARELRPEATGAVPAYGDSAIPRSYELFGTGQRQATDADRARLFGLAARVSSIVEGAR